MYPDFPSPDFFGVAVFVTTYHLQSGLVHPVWAMIAMVTSVSTVLANAFGGPLLPRRRRGAEARLTLRIANLHCEHCLAAIKEAVSRLPGIADVRGDPAAQLVTVTYQTGVADPDGIHEAILERGFKVAA